LLITFTASVAVVHLQQQPYYRLLHPLHLPLIHTQFLWGRRLFLHFVGVVLRSLYYFDLVSLFPFSFPHFYLQFNRNSHKKKACTLHKPLRTYLICPPISFIIFNRNGFLFFLL